MLLLRKQQTTKLAFSSADFLWLSMLSCPLSTLYFEWWYIFRKVPLWSSRKSKSSCSQLLHCLYATCACSSCSCLDLAGQAWGSSTLGVQCVRKCVCASLLVQTDRQLTTSNSFKLATYTHTTKTIPKKVEAFTSPACSLERACLHLSFFESAYYITSHALCELIW